MVDREPDFGRRRRKIVPIALGALLLAGFFAYAMIRGARFKMSPETRQSASTPAPPASECAELRHYLDKLPCVDDLEESVAQFCAARPGCAAATRTINHCRIAHGDPHCTPDGAIVSTVPFECMTEVSPSQPLQLDRAAICADAGEPFTP